MNVKSKLHSYRKGVNVKEQETKKVIINVLYNYYSLYSGTSLIDTSRIRTLSGAPKLALLYKTTSEMRILL